MALKRKSWAWVMTASLLAMVGSTAAQTLAPSAAVSGAKQTTDDAVARYLSGRVAQNAGEWDVATANLAAALKQDPTNPALLRRTFLLSLGEGRQTEAVGLARRLVATDHTSFVAHALLVADDMRAGRVDAAAERVAKLPADGMAPYIGPLFASWIAVAKGDHTKAISALDPLASHDGFKTIRTQQLALIEDQKGNREEAFKHYVEAAKGGTPLRLTLLIGNFQERAGSKDAARKLYQGYLSANPGSAPVEEALASLDRGAVPAPLVASPAQGMAEALFELASALHQEGALEMALLYGRVALHLDRDQPLIRLLLGDILDARGREETALAEYRAVGNSAGMQWLARLREVEVLRQMGQHDDAVALLTRMAAEKPTHVDALLRLGDLHRVAKRYKPALAAYDQALARRPVPAPEDWVLVYARAMVLDSLGNWDAAEQGLKQALALAPGQPGLLNYLGYSYIDRGISMEEGARLIERAMTLRPNDGFFTDSLGWARYKMGDIKAAVDLLEQAVQLEPADPAINDHLGDAYWSAGRQDEARFQWTRAARHAEDEVLRKAAEAKLKDGLTSGIVARNSTP